MIHRAHIIPFFLLLIFLAACSQARSAAPEETIPASPPPAVVLKQTATASPTQPATATVEAPPPSQTPTRPAPPSATASFTPTILAAPSATGSAQQCRTSFSGVVPTLEPIKPIDEGPTYADETEVLDFLNTYGMDAFYAQYQKVENNLPGTIQDYRDLTNDGLPEIAFASGSLYIIGCKDGHFDTLFGLGPDAYLQPPRLVNVVDANRNGLPEITLLLGYMSQGGHFYQVFEWNGDQFQSLVIPDDDWFGDSLFVEATGSLGYGDLDHDGMIEYIADIGIPVWETYSLGIPWRNEKQLYQWNGTQFVFEKRIFSAPEYRFQAVQDGDRAMQAGDLESALTFYRLAVFDDALQGWSPKQRNFLDTVFSAHFTNDPTPIPPIPLPEERDFITAYARYRIMLHHLARGWEADAKTVYDTLQKKYPAGKPGHIYAALANTVGTAFSETNDLGKACDRALEFASQNKDEIFYYISGSGYPGNHGIDYQETPEMICPFP